MSSEQASKSQQSSQPQPPISAERPFLIGLAGCSGSGKTSLARALAAELHATPFPLDLYYRDLSQFPLDSRDKRNFDHPDSLESELFIEHIRSLSQGQSIQRPIYDFATHTRVPGRFETVIPSRFVIVEGILALHYPDLLSLYGLSVYVDAPQKVCLTRRIRRDIRERGRTEASVRAQFEAAVRPMAEQFVIPSQQHATFTVSGCEPMSKSIIKICHWLRAQGLLTRQPSPEPLQHPITSTNPADNL